MDTWMGRSQDPVTLHKYLYANVNPVDNIDPSGNFTIGSVMSAVNTAATLHTIASASYSVFRVASGEEEFDALAFGTELILSKLGGSAAQKLINMIGKKGKELIKEGFDTIGCVFNSFPSGTLVYTSEGLRPIEEVEIGDKVLAFDEVSQSYAYEEVTHLIQGDKVYDFVVLELESGEVIEATPEHPFYDGSEWKQANELDVSDKLKLFYGSSFIASINRSLRQEKVYNFTVNNAHTFFVGVDGVLVHNQNKNSGCKFRGKKAKGFDWDHIFDRHSAGGNIAQQRSRLSGNTVFPANLTDKQIMARVKGGWKNRELRRSQTDPVTGETRLYYEGIDEGSGTTVGFWFNSRTGIVESAFPR